MTEYTDWEPTWDGHLRRFPTDNAPTMEQGFRIVRSEVDTTFDPPRETVLEWEPMGSPEGWVVERLLAERPR